MKFNSSTVFLLIIFLSCKSQKTSTSNGLVLYKTRYLDQNTKKFVSGAFEKDRKVWFKDSLIIGEGSHVNIKNDEFGNLSWENFVGEYTFIDLRTKSFYEYATFSDTAQSIDKYMQPDTGRNKRGWNFFSKASIFSLENLEKISDTTINGIIYKRIKSFKIVEIQNPEEQKLLGKQQMIIQVGYLRCDLKNSVFSLDKPLHEKFGCPIVRFDQISPSNNSWIITEREFLPNKLTPEELKVFEAWERNARQSPVHK